MPLQAFLPIKSAYYLLGHYMILNLNWTIRSRSFFTCFPFFSVLDWLSESLLYTNAEFRFNSNIRIFGKSEVNGHRRLGVLLARDISVEKALENVERAYAKLDVKL